MVSEAAPPGHSPADPGEGNAPGDRRRALAEALTAARFEVFPAEGVERAAAGLPPGTAVTVTCSPSRGIDASVELVERLAAAGARVVPHLSARLVADAGHLATLVERLAVAGVRDVFVIGGDAKTPVGPYDSSGALLADLARMQHPFTELGVAGYPEGHPLIGADALDTALKAKQGVATYLVTQLCFSPEAVVAWAERVRSLGVTLPIVVGVPGVVDRRRLLRLALRVGAGESTRFLRKHTGLVGKLLAAGGYDPGGLVEPLAAHHEALGGPLRGLHLYTFNEVGRTQTWRKRSLAAAEASENDDPAVG